MHSNMSCSGVQACVKHASCNFKASHTPHAHACFSECAATVESEPCEHVINHMKIT